MKLKLPFILNLLVAVLSTSLLVVETASAMPSAGKCILILQDSAKKVSGTIKLPVQPLLQGFRALTQTRPKHPSGQNAIEVIFADSNIPAQVYNDFSETLYSVNRSNFHPVRFAEAVLQDVKETNSEVDEMQPYYIAMSALRQNKISLAQFSDFSTYLALKRFTLPEGFELKYVPALTKSKSLSRPFKKYLNRGLIANSSRRKYKLFNMLWSVNSNLYKRTALSSLGISTVKNALTRGMRKRNESSDSVGFFKITAPKGSSLSQAGLDSRSTSWNNLAYIFGSLNINDFYSGHLGQNGTETQEISIPSLHVAEAIAEALSGRRDLRLLPQVRLSSLETMEKILSNGFRPLVLPLPDQIGELEVHGVALKSNDLIWPTLHDYFHYYLSLTTTSSKIRRNGIPKLLQLIQDISDEYSTAHLNEQTIQFDSLDFDDQIDDKLAFSLRITEDSILQEDDRSFTLNKPSNLYSDLSVGDGLIEELADAAHLPNQQALLLSIIIHATHSTLDTQMDQNLPLNASAASWLLYDMSRNPKRWTKAGFGPMVRTLRKVATSKLKINSRFIVQPLQLESYRVWQIDGMPGYIFEDESTAGETVLFIQEIWKLAQQQ